jgi:hypothetical protein
MRERVGISPSPRLKKWIRFRILKYIYKFWANLKENSGKVKENGHAY